MNITVYCGSNPGDESAFLAEAKSFGKWIAESGNTLVYGGSSVGIMGAISNAVIENGGPVIGVEPQYFIDAGVAQHDLSQLIVTPTMADRKAKMIELGDVFVAFPGGVGTLEEISEIMTRIRINITPPPCIFLNLGGFYEPLRTLLGSMEEHGFLPGFDKSDYLFMNSSDEAARVIESLEDKQRMCSTEADWVMPGWVSKDACI